MANDCCETKVLYLQSCLVEVFIKDIVFKVFTLLHIHTILINALLNINMHVFTIFVYILYRGHCHINHVVKCHSSRDLIDAEYFSFVHRV